MSILDLPIEQQKRIAKEVFKYDDFEQWQEDTRKRLEKTDAFIKALDEYKPTKAEIAEKIKRLREDKYAIGFYQRMTENYSLTVEEQIAHLESLETRD